MPRISSAGHWLMKPLPPWPVMSFPPMSGGARQHDVGGQRGQDGRHDQPRQEKHEQQPTAWEAQAREHVAGEQRHSQCQADVPDHAHQRHLYGRQGIADGFKVIREVDVGGQGNEHDARILFDGHKRAENHEQQRVEQHDT